MNVVWLWILATLMGTAGAYVLGLASRARTRFQMALALFLIAMMASMSLGVLLYDLLPPFLGIEIALFVGMWVMVLGIGFLISLMFETGHPPERDLLPRPAFRALITAGAIGTEAMLGLALGLMSGDLSGLLREPLVTALPGLLSSPWFIFPMAFEMGLSFLLVGRELPRFMTALLSIQPMVMALSPSAAPSTGWTTAFVVGGSVVMTAFYILVMEYVTRNGKLSRGSFHYILLVLGVYALMMAGIFAYVYDGGVGLFAISILLEMILFFDAILSPTRFLAGETVEWARDARTVFAIVFGVFVAEFFMGAALALTFTGVGPFLSALPTVPVSAMPLAALGSHLLWGLFFVTRILASPEFLLMMGAEMGALVVFKMRATRSRETRVRLGLVIGAYFVYAVYLPAFFFSPGTLPHIPLVGWSMGFGTGGGFVPGLLLVILATYAISGLLSLLFGARQMCSGLCTAAMMYQGSFYDSLKTFNRRSKIGNQLLGSRVSRLYGVVFSLSWVSITVAGILSYLNYVGTISLTVYGVDVATFTEVLYFNFLWYVLFVSIPFVGTYACVSSGYCYWGTFNQMLGRLGFFKLKVKDPATCITCPDKPCTRACPVGLTELPREFIRKGEFRALKCIGVGDCAEACPYENILFYDVRHWVREKITRERVIPPPAPHVKPLHGRIRVNGRSSPAAFGGTLPRVTESREP